MGSTCGVRPRGRDGGKGDLSCQFKQGMTGKRRKRRPRQVCRARLYDIDKLCFLTPVPGLSVRNWCQDEAGGYSDGSE